MVSTYRLGSARIHRRLRLLRPSKISIDKHNTKTHSTALTRFLQQRLFCIHFARTVPIKPNLCEWLKGAKTNVAHSGRNCHSHAYRLHFSICYSTHEHLGLMIISTLRRLTATQNSMHESPKWTQSNRIGAKKNRVMPTKTIDHDGGEGVDRISRDSLCRLNAILKRNRVIRDCDGRFIPSFNRPLYRPDHCL